MSFIVRLLLIALFSVFAVFTFFSCQSGQDKIWEVDGITICEYADGSRYEGFWREGKPHKYGKFIKSNGSVYVGEWKCGRSFSSG